MDNRHSILTHFLRVHRSSFSVPMCDLRICGRASGDEMGRMLEVPLLSLTLHLAVFSEMAADSAQSAASFLLCSFFLPSSLFLLSTAVHIIIKECVITVVVVFIFIIIPQKEFARVLPLSARPLLRIGTPQDQEQQ